MNGEPASACRTCDGTGYVESAAPDSRVIHHEPCRACAGSAFGVRRAACGEPDDAEPAASPEGQTSKSERHTPLVRALVQEYAALLAHAEPWQQMPAAEPSERDYFLGAQHALERVAARLGLTDLHARAAEVVARGTEGREP